MLRDLFSLFPACAGVILDIKRAIPPSLPFPRIRGGDPMMYSDYGKVANFSPHMRG